MRNCRCECAGADAADLFALDGDGSDFARENTSFLSGSPASLTGDTHEVL